MLLLNLIQWVANGHSAPVEDVPYKRLCSSETKSVTISMLS